MTSIIAKLIWFKYNFCCDIGFFLKSPTAAIVDFATGKIIFEPNVECVKSEKKKKWISDETFVAIREKREANRQR